MVTKKSWVKNIPLADGIDSTKNNFLGHCPAFSYVAASWTLSLETLQALRHWRFWIEFLTLSFSPIKLDWCEHLRSKPVEWNTLKQTIWNKAMREEQRSSIFTFPSHFFCLLFCLAVVKGSKYQEGRRGKLKTGLWSPETLKLVHGRRFSQTTQEHQAYCIWGNFRQVNCLVSEVKFFSPKWTEFELFFHQLFEAPSCYNCPLCLSLDQTFNNEMNE